MKKQLLLFCIAGLVTLASYGQATTEKLNQLKKDPQTNEHAAKADVFIIDKKIVADSSTKMIKSPCNKRKGNKRALKNKKPI